MRRGAMARPAKIIEIYWTPDRFTLRIQPQSIRPGRTGKRSIAGFAFDILVGILAQHAERVREGHQSGSARQNQVRFAGLSKSTGHADFLCERQAISGSTLTPSHAA
jgi:hypothetical protein